MSIFTNTITDHPSEESNIITIFSSTRVNLLRKENTFTN